MREILVVTNRSFRPRQMWKPKSVNRFYVRNSFAPTTDKCSIWYCKHQQTSYEEKIYLVKIKNIYKIKLRITRLKALKNSRSLTKSVSISFCSSRKVYKSVFPNLFCAMPHLSLSKIIMPPYVTLITPFHLKKVSGKLCF